MRSENGPLVPQLESGSGVEEGEKGVREGASESAVHVPGDLLQTRLIVCVKYEDRYFAPRDP